MSVTELTSEEGGRDDRGISRRSVELVVALVLMVLCTILAWDNNKIGAGWGGAGPEAGYFPFRLAVGVGLCGLAIFISAFREGNSELFATWLQLKRVFQLLVPLVVYVASISYLGIYLSSALFIACFMKFAGGYGIVRSLATGVITNLVMFYVFELQFSVPLPKGPIEALFGY